MNTIRTGLGLAAIALCCTGCALLNKTDSAAAPIAGGTVTPATAAATPYVWSASMEAKRVAVERASADSGIAVLRTTDNQLQINVPSDFSFDTDSAAIKPAMRPVLDQVAQDLEIASMSQMLILVVGHTDSRGTSTVNEALSRARALSVRKYLEGKGVASARIAVEGHGEREPLVDNGQSYGRALNRRVEIFLREPGA